MVPTMADAPARVLTSLTLTALSTALLAGCGSSSPRLAARPAAEILDAARNAATSARAVTIKTTASQGRSSAHYELVLNRNSGLARISLFGIEYEAIRIGNALYVRLPRSARSTGAPRTRHLPGGWLKTTTGNPSYERFALLTTLKTAARLELDRLTSPTKKTSRQHDTVTLTEKIKLGEATLTTTTDTGTPYPATLQISGRERNTTTYTRWNQPQPVSPPRGL